VWFNFPIFWYVMPRKSWCERTSRHLKMKSILFSEVMETDYPANECRIPGEPNTKYWVH